MKEVDTETLHVDKLSPMRPGMEYNRVEIIIEIIVVNTEPHLVRSLSSCRD